MKSQACMVCHDNRADALKSKVIHFSSRLRDIEPYTERRHTLTFNINIKCKYGLQCDNINRTLNSIRRNLDELSSKMITIALSEDDRLYYECLQFLRGDFPAAYNQLERIHSQKAI